MKVSKNRCLFWGVLSGVSLLASAFPLCNFWAAVDLGYDRSSRGKTIIAWWCYAMLGLVASSIGCAALAIRSWWSNRKFLKGSAESGQRQPRLLLDFLIVAVAAALGIFASCFGLDAGHPPSKGVGAVLGSVYVLYLGVLFLFSYFFSDACYVFNLLTYLCEGCSRPRSRYMAWFYFALSLVLGVWLLLIGLGVFAG